MSLVDKKVDITGGNPTEWPDVLLTRIGVMTYLTPQFSVLDAAALKQLGEVFEYCLQEKEKRIVIDLTKVKSINSSSLTGNSRCCRKNHS